MSKHVAVLITVMNCVLISTFVGACIDCNNMHTMDNMKLAVFTAICNFRLTKQRKICKVAKEFRCKTKKLG